MQHPSCECAVKAQHRVCAGSCKDVTFACSARLGHSSHALLFRCARHGEPPRLPCLPLPHMAVCSARIAFKVDSGQQPEQQRRSGQQQAARRSAVGVKDNGLGLYSWWRDSSASGVGTDMRVDVQNPSVGSCLQACNNRAECTAVTFQVDAGAGVSSCSLRRGVAFTGNSMRTLVRTRVSSVVAM